MNCRRDQGFSYLKHPGVGQHVTVHTKRSIPLLHDSADTVCDGSLFLCYILPALLHLCAFAHTIYLLRLTENEHLQTLFEKASALCFLVISAWIVYIYIIVSFYH